MPSQRPFFLSSFISAFRQQGPSIQPSTQQPNKHTTTATPQPTSSSSTNASSTTGAVATASPSRSISTTATSHHHQHHHHHHSHSHSHTPQTPSRSAGIPIQSSHHQGGSSRRRGSDSSSEGFRDVLGADKWYIGGRTAGGEERFFKLGVVRRVRSNDGLSLDRLSL